MAIKVTPKDPKEANTVVVKSKKKSGSPLKGYKWWDAGSKKDLANQMITTASFLKEQQEGRVRAASIQARLYGNVPLFNSFGANFKKLNINNNLPTDRPTMNVIQSCVDTLVSRLTQGRPRPMFLTDNADYKERNLSKQLNQFIVGELFQTRAYEKGPLILRDGLVLGTGSLKVYRDINKRVALDRTLCTELLVDPNDAFYGDPRVLYQFKLVDRDLLYNLFPDQGAKVEGATQAYVDEGNDKAESVSDQVLLVEGWRLPSGKDTGDGLHAIACSSGLLFEEEYKRSKFPFAFLHYSPRLTGFWGQPLTEQLMGTQVEINKLLITISKSINLVGVPRVFVEDGSKVVKAHLNDAIGSIVTYRGTKPIYEVAPCVAPEIYAQLQRLVEYAYQQSGVSALAAAAKKPSGLNSGEAIRNYDDLQSDRFASLEKAYDRMYEDLAYLIIDEAREICEQEGSYQTVYPNKNGTKEIDLPSAKLLDNPFVIQCFDVSSLPRDPAGRLQKVTEMAQSGMISMQEARRLLDYPDLEQTEKLANASEERILQILDEIVDEGKYTPPDPFMNLELANELCVKYYNLYVPAKLEESKAEKLRQFFAQVQDEMQKAASPQPAQAPGGLPQPQAVPEAPPTSPLLPNGPQAGA